MKISKEIDFGYYLCMTALLVGLLAFSTPSQAAVWVSGSNVVDQTGVYGTKGTAASTNVPGARDSGVSWIDKNGNLWLFGGADYNFDLFNDLWKFNGTNWTWVSGSNGVNQAGTYGTKGVAASGNVPGARFSSSNWIDGNGNLWLFGGANYSLKMFNDLWKFNGTNWTWVSGSNGVNQAGTYGTKGVAASGNVPGARFSSSNWIDGNGNLWLFGGANDNFDLFNDLWKFDGTNWTWVSGSNGVNQNGVYGTKGIAAATNIPGSRYSAVSWIDKNGNLWLFGGEDANSDLLNDLWKFDGTNWTWVSGSNVVNQNGVYGTKGVAASTNVPGARLSSYNWIDSSGNLWLFGGSGYDGSENFDELNDLWKFDGTNWTWVSGSNIADQNGVYGTEGVAAATNLPGSRDAGVSWIDGSGNLWLLGGYGYDSGGNEDELNDLWKFEACQQPVGDLNGDCRVDFRDFAIFAANWLKQTSVGDLNGDGKVNFKDLYLFAADWLDQTYPQ